ncbi:MAG: type II toxin-antitoxin system VapC family toxin [Pseudomonadota bacterium]
MVYFDACCFIDLAMTKLSIPTLSEREKHIYFCRKLLEAARAREVTVYTSTVTMAECVKLEDTSKPNGQQVVSDERVQKLFKGMLQSGVGVIPVAATPTITEAARNLRWKHGITVKPMDAIHIATALAMKCTHFVTTDDKLGVENVKRIAELGLTVCRADMLSPLVPSKYLQIELQPKPARGAVAAVAPDPR